MNVVAGEPGQRGVGFGVVAGVLIMRSEGSVGVPEPPPALSLTRVDDQRRLGKLAQVVARGPTVGMQHGRQRGGRCGTTEA